MSPAPDAGRRAPERRALRVLLVSRIFAPESAAATFRLSALVRALVQDGAQVEVLTAAAPPGARVDDARDGSGARVSRWPVLRDASGYVRGYLPYLSFDLPLALRLAAARRPDVVVVEPPPTTGAVVRTVLGLRGRLTGHRVPYVYYAADVWSDASAATGAPAVVVTLLRALERWALRGAARVVAVSEGVAARVGDLGGRPERVQVVPNGIDTDVFTLAGPVAPEVPGDTAYLVYAGTASEWQGAEIFAEAMPAVLEQLPGARLVLLGQGSSWPVLGRMASELAAGAIELRLLVPPEQAAAWLRGAAGALVSVRPGLGYDFAYPTKVLAALACGTPVVFAGPGPAADDVAAHDLGLAVPYDVTAVARAMVSALRSGEGRQVMAERQRRHAWVVRHRSVSSSAAAAAAEVLRAAWTDGDPVQRRTPGVASSPSRGTHPTSRAL